MLAWGIIATICFIIALVLLITKKGKVEIHTEVKTLPPDKSEIEKLERRKTELKIEIVDLEQRRDFWEVSVNNQRKRLIDERVNYDIELGKLKNEISDAIECNRVLNVDAAALEASIQKSKVQLEALAADLKSLQEQRAEANARLTEQGGGRYLEHNQNDAALTKVLDNLRTDFPQYADLWADIEWKKLWQPKFQAMTTDLMTPPVTGIYRIYTIDNDGNVRSYIGQARNIRERWSEHIKAMVGIAKPNNSKLYSAVKPYNAYFEIIERCNAAELNEKEHYWIKYYDSVRTGYNIKT